jgi:hypothetical protein
MDVVESSVPNNYRGLMKHLKWMDCRIIFVSRKFQASEVLVVVM